MSQFNAKEARKAILNAISKRPNTRFAKLFHEVDNAPSQKNIVLLLIELTQQKDFYVDFNIPIQYFLDLYETIDASHKEFLFNEAGLLIFNASQVYSRRLDCVQERIEDQLAALSNGQETKETDDSNTNNENDPAQKPKRTRKRLIEATTDPYDVQIEAKKFRKLTIAKRFASGTLLDKSKAYQTGLDVESYIHPALWKHAEIVDLENEDDFDSKRNYRLFTSHLEHRYNTLVPDINFSLYFRIKDFVDEEYDDDNEVCPDNNWPSGYSQAYIKRYIDLENQAIGHKGSPTKKKRKLSPIFETELKQEQIKNSDETMRDAGMDSGFESTLMDSTFNSSNSTATKSLLQTSTDANVTAQSIQSNSVLEDSVETLNSQTETQLNTTSTASDVSLSQQNDSGISLSQQNDSGISLSQESCTNLTLNVDDNPDLSDKLLDDIAKSVAANSTMQTELGLDLNETLRTSEIKNLNKSEDSSTIKADSSEAKQNMTEPLKIIINNSKVSSDSYSHLSPQNDEGVYFSDTDDTPLTPITPQIVDNHLGRETTTINADSNVKCSEIYELPQTPAATEWQIKYNIFEFPAHILRKMRRKVLLTNLGEDMELYLKARNYKRVRLAGTDKPMPPSRVFKVFNAKSLGQYDYLDTPPASPQSDADLLGFTEDGKCVLQKISENFDSSILRTISRNNDQNLRLSRDSGVGNELTTTMERKMSFPPISEDDEKLTAAEISPSRRNSFSKQVDQENLVSDNSTQQNLENIKEKSAVVILENKVLVTANEKDRIQSPSTVEKEPSKLGKDLAPETTKSQVDNNGNNLKDSTVENIEPAVVDNLTNDLNHDTQAPVQALLREDINRTNLLTPTHAEHTNNIEENRAELSEQTVSKIQTWHRHLQPILAHSRERHHFDVFEIGTNILNGFKDRQSSTNSANEITFQDVMQQQDPSYVSRYFLSALLLANQGNIKLSVVNGSDDKPSAWSDVHFKLLSNTRHVVSMEDNIGMIAAATATDSQTTTPATKEVPATTPVTKKPVKSTSTAPPSRKRNSTALEVNLNAIEMVKPIGKAPRKSDDYDSGIYSIVSSSS